MRPAKIEYVLSASYSDRRESPRERGQQRSFLVRNYETAKSNTKTQYSFHADLMNKDTIGLDVEKELAKLSDEDKARESELFQGLFDAVEEGGFGFRGLSKAVTAYVDQSKIFKRRHKSKLKDFFSKYEKSTKLFEEFNNSAMETDRQMSRAQNKLVSRLRRIWGSAATIRNDASEKLGAGLAGFRDLIDDLDDKTPPLSFQTEVNYDLRIKKLKLPEVRSLRRAFGMHKHFAGAVSVWQLPASLFAIQDKLGIMLENAPKFRLCLDTLGDKESAFRVSCEGDKIDDMLAALDEKLADEERFSVHDGLPMQLTFHNYASQQAIFLQTRVADNFAALKADISGAVNGIDFKQLRKFKL